MRMLLAACALAALGMPVAAQDAAGVERGVLSVPESRARPQGRAVKIPYVRVRTTAAQPVAPIFLLAGGPGDSGLEFFETEEGRAQAELFRRFGDVVMFDQRGAGRSVPSLKCPDRLALPMDVATTSAAYDAAIRETSKKCRAHFDREGVDLAAYNTRENAADVDALRKALGYGKITLVGGSYGSHLALALLREHRAIVANAILYGVEGPDHTFDLAAEVLAAFRRLDEAARRMPAFAGRLPPGGVLEALRSVEQRLEREPAVVTVNSEEGPVNVTLGKLDVQHVVSSGALNRDNFAWAARILAMYEGDYSRLAMDSYESRQGDLDAMYFMMDCASGVSPQRLARTRSEESRAATDLIGDSNSDYAACDVWRSPDLGAAFRADIVSDVPALIFQGTWDFATPFENAVEVARGLRNAHLVTVERGTHLTLKDLRKLWPPFETLLGDFLRGREIDPPVRIGLPDGGFKEPLSPSAAAAAPRADKP